MCDNAGVFFPTLCNISVHLVENTAKFLNAVVYTSANFFTLAAFTAHE